LADYLSRALTDARGSNESRRFSFLFPLQHLILYIYLEPFGACTLKIYEEHVFARCCGQLVLGSKNYIHRDIRGEIWQWLGQKGLISAEQRLDCVSQAAQNNNETIHAAAIRQRRDKARRHPQHQTFLAAHPVLELPNDSHHVTVREIFPVPTSVAIQKNLVNGQ